MDVTCNFYFQKRKFRQKKHIRILHTFIINIFLYKRILYLINYKYNRSYEHYFPDVNFERPSNKLTYAVCS